MDRPDGQKTASPNEDPGSDDTPTQPSANGWFRVDNEAVHRITDVGLLAFGVYAVILRFADGRTRVSRVGQQKIAGVLGKTNRAVRGAIAQLVGAGWLERKKRPGKSDIFLVIPLEYRKPASAPAEKGGNPLPDPAGRAEVSLPTARKPGSGLDGLPRKPPSAVQDPSIQHLSLQQKNGAAEIPSQLDTPAFREAWEDWLRFNRARAKGRPLPRQSQEAQLRELAAWGEQAAVLAIRNSIKANWTGVYEPKNGNSRRPQNPGRGQRHPADGDRKEF